jgi:hypothetical protein
MVGRRKVETGNMLGGLEKYIGSVGDAQLNLFCVVEISLRIAQPFHELLGFHESFL